MTAPGSPCVLVVDDEEGIRETLREIIEMLGCTALTAADGAEALALLETHRPSLILLDLLMPVMTGYELLALLRCDERFSGVHIVISTSAPAQAPAGVPILPKPIDIERLWRCLRETCRCGAASSTPRR
jgi:CheY-like chemotaxis protein